MKLFIYFFVKIVIKYFSELENLKVIVIIIEE